MDVSKTLERPDGETIAYRLRTGNGAAARGVGVIWLGGFHSDMTGTKAAALDAWAVGHGRSYVRFDYFGHGRSSGAFADGTIGRWRDDALAVIDRLTRGPQVLVGSSMGGWIALLVALVRPERVAGLALIAPAPDFTEDLMWAELPAALRDRLESDGVIEIPSGYDDGPYIISRRLIDDGRRHLVLRDPIKLACPVRILHGMEDKDVPWRRSLLLVERLSAGDVTVTFVKNGDHRLSDAVNIARVTTMVEALCHEVDGIRSSSV